MAGEDQGEPVYTQVQVDKALNDCRITERYNAWIVMANMGIPAERIPQPFKEARDIVTVLVNTPKKGSIESPPAAPAQ